MSKEPLLFLCHRIPFPPNKGDKIRSFNILKWLNQHFDVYLGCFIDDPYDQRYVDELAKHCHQLFYLNQNKNIAKIKGLTSLLSGKPITLPYYFDAKMQCWVDQTINKHGIGKAFIYSSSMAQYCQGDSYQKLTRIIDFVDVDSDKWRQYAEKKSGISKWIFNREYQLLAKYEDKVCQQFDHSLFVSPDEAKLFSDRQQAADRAKVAGILNGVDIAFFDPDAQCSQEPLLPATPFISFTGAMDYWANVDAVVWFVEHVWPQIQSARPDVKFVIAGGNPTPQVQALASDKIIVTGRVNDVRPFIKKAACVVAPLRIARGIQNKVLEAMSLDKPVVCTSMAMEGINAAESDAVKVEDNPQQFADYCLAYLSANETSTSDLSGNRKWIIEHFTWQQTLQPLTGLFKTN